MFETLDDVKAANAAAGQTWFSQANADFFGTRLVSPLFGGRYFVTSERPPWGGVEYSIRVAHPDGEVGTAGEFGEYATREAALAVIAGLVKS